MKKLKINGKKIMLGEGLQNLLEGQFSLLSHAQKETHPEWVSVADAKRKLIHLVQEYYQQSYPSCKISFGAEHSENVSFFCEKMLWVYFRVQSKASSWPEDTLVIANISVACNRRCGDVLSELFDFLIAIQGEVGFFNLGFEHPGMDLIYLIKNFGFEMIENSEEYWTISMVALKERAGPSVVS